MSRDENDLRAALRQLEHRADEHGAPTKASLLAATAQDGVSSGASRRSGHARWLAPLAVAAAVAAVIIAITLSSGSRDSGHQNAPAHSRSEDAALSLSRVDSPSPVRTAPSTQRAPVPSSTAIPVLDAAAGELAATRNWTTPAPNQFFYVHTTDATTWTSVSGKSAGEGRAPDGTKMWIPGCENGRIVSNGEAGPCTLNDVPHYLADAPTTPSAWDRYLEHMAPGAKAGGAQGKIIVQVLHEDLVAPGAAAALLRYTATCPGLHTFPVRPAHGRELIGVTCTSMTNGSYGLAFDRATHALVGFVGVNGSGQQEGPAEIVLETGIVAAVGRKP